MLEKYRSLIAQINEGVVEFNELLAPQCRVGAVVTNDPKMFRETVAGKWGGDVWPSSDYRGVYFLFSSHENGGDLGLYIGKATMQNIGGRLYAHTKKYRDAAAFLRPSPDGNFIIEAIGAIAIADASQICIAAALEEFLLSRGVNSPARLLNYVGVSQQY